MGPYTAENYEKNTARIQELICKKYKKWDEHNRDGVGLTTEEMEELTERQTWQSQALSMLSNYFQTYCQLQPGDLVEATFEDGTIVAKIHENKRGTYIITTPDGNGSGCGIHAHKVRKLSAVEIFTLGVSSDKPIPPR